MTGEECDAITSLPHLESLWIQSQQHTSEQRHEAKASFGCFEITPGAIAEILAQRTLRWLDVSNCQLSRQDFIAISNHLCLEGVRLHSTNISDRELSAILNLPKLREVGFANTRVTGMGLERHPGSRSIESIVCDGTPVGAEFAAFVARSPKITILGVRHPTVDDAFIRLLEAHPSLETLTLGPKVTDRVVDSLLTIPSLKSVDVRESSLSLDARARLLHVRPFLRLN